MHYKSILDQLTPIQGELPRQKSNKVFLTALLPMLLMAILFYGLEGFKTISVAVITCLIFKYLFQKYYLKTTPTLRDGSALITGILVAFTLPTGVPVWLIVLGSLIAIALSESVVIKSGFQTFNPILLSWLLLRVAFPTPMTIWSTNIAAIDSITGATPLLIVKEGIKNGRQLTEILADKAMPGYFDLFWGNMSGSLGEISAIALLIGAIYLLWKKAITWHIPVALLSTFLLFQGLFWMAASGSFVNPVFHLLTGGLIFGAWFLATDPAASPSSPNGKLIFGAGIGLITFLLRNFTSLPEGIAIAILLMNGLTPVIRKYFPSQGKN